MTVSKSSKKSKTNKNNQASDLEKIIKVLAKKARELINLGFEDLNYNSKGDFIDATEEQHWQTIVNIFDLASRYEKSYENHAILGYALTKLANHKKDQEEIDILHSSIFHLEQAKKINSDYEDLSFLAWTYAKLGDALEGVEKIQAYLTAEKLYREHLNNNQEPVEETYHYFGSLLGSLANECVGFSEKIKKRKESISYLQKAVRFNQKDEFSHYGLGEELISLAEDTSDIQRKTRLYNFSLKHLRKSYKIDKAPETLKLIEEITEDIPYKT
jgi:tetratricopeptide (TPR) repeat protein